MQLRHLPLLLLIKLSATWADDTNFGGEEGAAAAAETTTAAAAAAAAEEGTDLEVRQASRQVNCNCQCSSITFLDKFGKINGNCASADNSGAVWCYVDPRYNQCADLQQSRRTSSLWSYQACATPGPTSPQCGNFFGGNTGGFGGSTGGFGGSTGGFGGSTGGFGGNTGGFGGSTGGLGGSTGGFGGSTGGFGGSTGGFGGSTGGFGGSSTGGFGGSTGSFGGSTGGFGGSTGFNNNGFPNNNNGINNGGIRSPTGSIGGSPLVGIGNPGFSLGSGVASGPDGFNFQENGGFQAVVSLAEKKATAGKEEPAPASESSDSVSFSR